MKHISRLKVQSSHIDRFGNVSTPSLFWYLQEIAWEHAQSLGFGFDHLREDQLYWVLSRILINVGRCLKWTEEFTLETWSRGTDGFFAYRDFRFIDSKGEEISTATSSWLVLDLASKRIQRLHQFKNFPAYQASVLGCNPGKVAPPVLLNELEFTPVQFSELDINQHVNSGRYLERINNNYSFEFLEKYVLKQMEVNFLKEGLPNDGLAVKRQQLSPTEHLCSIVRECDGADLIRARLVWEEK
jgi:medium-chain acyl-[acyl-carrier-protein] hydrolase